MSLSLSTEVESRTGQNPNKGLFNIISILINIPSHLIGKISTRAGKTEGRVAEG